ncbi:leupaxin isoform X2 [Diaphorina citri]|uniref:Leupaxin isoform X2 n=1 Tax=Diaphorina citri TaxID=121845 RepID=A0A3Q0INX8_DIACI|nr:leupaxin isoform X2 [Diaphorina citri]
MDDLDALLADLQNTISPSPGGYSVKSTKDHLYSNSRENQVSPPPHHTLKHTSTVAGDHRSSPHLSSSSPPPHISTSLNNNLNELDSLLQDLSSHKYPASSAPQYSPPASANQNQQFSSNQVYSPPANQLSARAVGDLGSSPSRKDAPYAPPPLDTIVKGSPASPAPAPSPLPASFQPSSNSTALVPSSPSNMNGTMDSNSYHHQFNGHNSVDTLLDELNSSLPHDEKGNHVVTKLLMEEMTTTTTTTVRPTASSATRELDDLMSSLSDFKVVPQQLEHSVTDSSSVSYSKPNQPVHQKGKQLDCMLDSLTAEMSRQGVTTTQKGCCSSCDKPIVGQVITALGKTWHPEHFICTHCNQELGTRNFFERDSRPYCEPDYHNLFSPRCSYCNGPILDKCVTALEKTWHTEHFFCAQCGKQFGEDGFHEKDGKPYCRDDYFDLFAPKCGGCNRAIMENYVSALNTQWHSTCFVCRDCRQPFQGGSFFDHEGLPYCETHYHAKRGSLCAGCHKPITGRCITAMFRKFHPEHFVCAFCLRQLNKGTFKEQNDKPYCHGCFEKLFG